MENKMQEMINRLLEKEERSEMDEKMLELLQAKQAQLGEDPSEEAVEEALRDVIKEHFLFMLRRKMKQNDPEDDVDEDEEESLESLQEATEIVRGVFRDMDLRFRDYRHQKGVRAFELGIREDGKLLRMKVYLEAEDKVCRVDAIYPFVADREFIYPLCAKLMAESYPRRFGALQFDTRDGELSYRYSFPMTHGLHRDDFKKLFLIVVKSAMASYDVAKRYATGRFPREERASIAEHARELLSELE